MKCTNCNNELPYVGGFCPYCGVRVELDSPQPVQQVRDERRQQSALEPVAVEKPKAPQDSRQQRSLDPQTIEEKPKKKNSGIMIAATIVVVALVLVGAFFSIHIWEDATCKAPKTCVICGKTEGVEAHNWVEATRYTPKKCTLCLQVDGLPLVRRYKIPWRYEKEFGKLSNSNTTVTTADGKKISGKPYVLDEPIENCVGLYLNYGSSHKAKAWGVWVRDTKGEWHMFGELDDREKVLVETFMAVSIDRFIVAPIESGNSANYRMSVELNEVEVLN